MNTFSLPTSQIKANVCLNFDNLNHPQDSTMKNYLLVGLIVLIDYLAVFEVVTLALNIIG